LAYYILLQKHDKNWGRSGRARRELKGYVHGFSAYDGDLLDFFWLLVIFLELNRILIGIVEFTGMEHDALDHHLGNPFD